MVPLFAIIYDTLVLCKYFYNDNLVFLLPFLILEFIKMQEILHFVLIFTLYTADNLVLFSINNSRLCTLIAYKKGASHHISPTD